MVLGAHNDWNPWAHDANTFDLYRRRCRLQAEEMTCAGQAAEIFAPLVSKQETLLDAGCGGGYYIHSFKKRHIPVQYHGLDYTPEMIALARTETCPRAGLATNAFQLGAIELVEEQYDNVLCFNVLTNSPHYALPLERLLRATRKRLLLRESMAEALVVRYTPDPYLDLDHRHIRVYHNTYPMDEVVSFMQTFGFRVTTIPDRRTGDKVEMVVDIPHHWRILLAERVG